MLANVSLAKDLQLVALKGRIGVGSAFMYSTQCTCMNTMSKFLLSSEDLNSKFTSLGHNTLSV